MTSSEIARDKLKYWSLIDRARKVGFKIPDHWTKYGMPPTNASEIVLVGLESIVDKMQNIFEMDNKFYERIKRK